MDNLKEKAEQNKAPEKEVVIVKESLKGVPKEQLMKRLNLLNH